MLVLIHIKKIQVVDNVKSRDIIRVSCFLLFIQRSLKHLLRFDMLVLISVKNVQIMNNVESKDIIKASRFLLFIQRSLIHLLCFDMLVLISIETIKTMKSITNLSECIVIEHIDVMKFSCTSICMRKQSLLRNSILRF